MSAPERFHALDALRAFALLLGIAFHAALSFLPQNVGWAAHDSSPSWFLAAFAFISHIFRMPVFFLIAGFFGRLVYHRKGEAGFVRDRLRRVAIPLIAGWPIIISFVMVVWVWGAQRSGAPWLPEQARNVSPFLAGPIGLFMRLVQGEELLMAHLWFLHYLLLCYVIWIALRRVFERLLDPAQAIRLRLDSVVRGCVRSRSGAILLCVPAAMALGIGAMQNGTVATPETSLLPRLGVLSFYFTFFALGWLLHRQTALLKVWETRWLSNLSVAGILTLLVLGAFAQHFVANPAPPAPAVWAQLLYTGLYALCALFWVFGLTGFCLRFLSGHCPVVRYLADSSYWLYLVHLPLVCALQVLMAKWPLHWSLKFPLILAISTPILLASYHWMVRFTFIGAILNGRRHPRTSPEPAESTVPFR